MGYTVLQHISVRLVGLETSHPALQGMHWLVLAQLLKETNWIIATSN